MRGRAMGSRCSVARVDKRPWPKGARPGVLQELYGRRQLAPFPVKWADRVSRDMIAKMTLVLVFGLRYTIQLRRCFVHASSSK